MLWLAALLVTMLGTACRKDSSCGVPHGVGGTIDLTMPQYYELGHVGGNMTLEADEDSIAMGHRGIYVVRTTVGGEFKAYECACPKDHDVAVRPADGWDGSLLQCPSCKSIFSVYADGTPVEGAATPCSLYQYDAILLSDGYHLHIY